MAFDSFNDGQIREIYRLKESNWSIREIVGEFDSSVGTISRILNPDTDEQQRRVDLALSGQGDTAPSHSNGAQISKPATAAPSVPESPRPIFSRKNPSQIIVPANSPSAYQCGTCRNPDRLFQWHPNEYICPKAVARYGRR